MKPTRINKHGKVLKGRKPQIDRNALVDILSVPAKGKKKTPPTPPPPKVPNIMMPTPPPFDEVVAGEKAASKAAFNYNHPKPPPDATHMEFRTPDGGTTVVVPVGMYGDFSSLKGTVRYGRLRYNEDFIADAPAPGTEPVEPATPKAPKAPKAPGKPREGVCAFIDALIMEGGRSAEAIRDLTVAKFPGRDPAATLNTVRVRPSHIRRKGQTPPPFKS